MKEKGVVLMETVIVLLILTIIFTMALLSCKSLRKYKTKIDLDYSVNELVDILSVARSYSRKKNCNTYVLLDESQNLYIVSGAKIIKTFKLKDGIFIDKFNFGEIKINKFGYVTNATKIVLKDKFQNERKITIMVGTSYVNVKEEARKHNARSSNYYGYTPYFNNIVFRNYSS